LAEREFNRRFLFVSGDLDFELVAGLTAAGFVLKIFAVLYDFVADS
jgi:hypothetical protein